MRNTFGGTLALGLAAVLAVPAASWAKKCPADSVEVGDVCVDKYEASVWSTADASTIKKIRKGKITSAAKLAAATQHGTSDDYGAGCPDTGNGCTGHYAVSIAGVTPAANMTWFQASAACRNAGKHLATNQEWQAAAFGTPDPGTDNGTDDCNVATASFTLPEDPVHTGSRSGCVSDVGAFDMVGNLHELVADWVPRSTENPGWGGFSDDFMGLSGASTTALGPGVLRRGGAFNGVFSGVFAVLGDTTPQSANSAVGFRCARRP